MSCEPWLCSCFQDNQVCRSVLSNNLIHNLLLCLGVFVGTAEKCLQTQRGNCISQITLVCIVSKKSIYDSIGSIEMRYWQYQKKKESPGIMTGNSGTLLLGRNESRKGLRQPAYPEESCLEQSTVLCPYGHWGGCRGDALEVQRDSAGLKTSLWSSPGEIQLALGKGFGQLRAKGSWRNYRASADLSPRRTTLEWIFAFS
ncbi:hypothetical protein WMY93_032330 [Mugilogobius chulae]|uniref:Uncharacterized protein n=1 Tax=Mugilogobius chulae TaxID=88201 RepID=A0AAW0MNM1_9GOBI